MTGECIRRARARDRRGARASPHGAFRWAISRRAGASEFRGAGGRVDPRGPDAGPAQPGHFPEQTQELLAALVGLLEAQPRPMQVTQQTVFLRQAGDQAECERLFAAFYGSRPPVTTFVPQPPCCGAALAVEAWAIGGEGVRIEHFGSRALAVSYDGVRWVYCAGLQPAPGLRGVYAQTLDVLGQMKQALGKADSAFQHVVRTWLYLGGITELEGGLQRYQELNRARTDFYEPIRFGVAGRRNRAPSTAFIRPAPALA